MKNLKKIFLAILFFAAAFLISTLGVRAQGLNENVNGIKYEFGKNSKYVLSDYKGQEIINDEGTMFGLFSIDGDITIDKDEENTYEVESGNVLFKYELNKKSFKESEQDRYICLDKTKKVNGEKLDDKIGRGTIIVQSSIDGNRWITDSIYNDLGSSESEFNGEVYTTKDIQQINGCFFRIIVVYKTNQKNGKKNDYVKNAEVYQFYIVNSNENSVNFASPDTTPKKELGKVEKKKNNSGYYVDKQIKVDDVHYGWDIGTFYVNGFTRDTVDSVNSNPVFLKNVGDRVTLWFRLNQNIENLNNNEKLIIATDKDGYDQLFQTPKQNFGRGTLIIRYTDYNGVKHEPVIYTDYLAANARTGADTKVELFEEGDYEVVLDYEVKEKKLFGQKNDYQIKFEFSIRNGNCMVYPFDVNTGSELSDGAITTDGFSLDMARSRYLNIDVKRTVLNKGKTGYVEDVRFNRPAKDGDQYTDSGIYTFDVKNLYTGEHTTKIIYVGDDSILKALSKTGMSVKQIEAELNNGATIDSDGSLSYPYKAETIGGKDKTVIIYKEETKKEEAPVENEKMVENEEKTIIIQESLSSTNQFYSELTNLLDNRLVIVALVIFILIPFVFMFCMLIEMSRLRKNITKVVKAIERSKQDEEKN